MTAPTLLLGIDLEDVRSMIPDGSRHRERVPHNTERLLALLAERGLRSTFFTVGDVARRYPDLVREIAQAGHEIACHGDDHTPLDRLGPEGFRADLERCLDSLAKAGVAVVKGFRAPMGSLTESTRWAYEILAELGFEYSSSVMPGRLLLYGWPGFGGDEARRMDGIWELPLSLIGPPLLKLPLAAGVFLRAIPLPLIELGVRRRMRTGAPIVGYLHPYDIDDEQERFTHPEIGESRLLHRLMYLNRHDTMRRLGRLFDSGARLRPYADYVADTLAASERRAQKAS